jgi:hypothetical protein
MNGYNNTITSGDKVIWMAGERPLRCTVKSVATNGKAAIECPSGGIANVSVDILIHASEYEGWLDGLNDQAQAMLQEQTYELYANGMATEDDLAKVGLVDLTRYLR